MTAIPRPVHLRRAAPVAVLVTGALVLSGCGGGDDSSKTKDAAATGPSLQVALADDVPARAALYAEASIRPTGESKAAIKQVTDLFGVADPGKAIIDGLDLDEELGAGKTFAKDILPYLGEHIGGFVLPSVKASKSADDTDGALVAEVGDAAKLRATFDADTKTTTKTTVDGQPVYRDKGDGTLAWVGDKTLAIGTADAVKATIAATKGDTLADNARFKAAISQVKATDPLAAFWMDFQQADSLDAVFSTLQDETGDVAKGAGLSSSDGKQLDQLRQQSKKLQDSLGDSIPTADMTVAVALEAKPGQIRLKAGGTWPKSADGKTPTNNKESADIVAALPSNSWIALGASLAGLPGSTGTKSPLEAMKQLDPSFAKGLPKDLAKTLTKLKTFAISVHGDSLTSAGGALVLGMQDPASANQLLDDLSALATKQGGMDVTPRKIPGTERAVITSGGSLPISIAAGIKGSQVAIGPGQDAVSSAFEPSAKLSTAPIYASAKTALDGDLPSVLIDPQPLAQLLGSLPLDDDPQFTQVLDVIKRIKLITAAGVDTGPTTWRNTLAITFDGRPISDTKPGR